MLETSFQDTTRTHTFENRAGRPRIFKGRGALAAGSDTMAFSTMLRPVFLALALLTLAQGFLVRPSSFPAVAPTSSRRAASPSISMMAPASAKLSKLPTIGNTFNDEVKRQATEAVQAALKQGIRRIEVEFPVDPGRIDVSLGEFLDESRRWTREFIRPFTTKGQKLWVVFPDGKEATLARSKWGETNFRVMGLKTAKEVPKEEPCELMVIVTPGFNIDEFLDLEKVDRGVPVVIVNGNLDRVRSGYYPRLFYPGLYAVKERYLKYFDPVYYLKPLPGGFIFRKYPEPWQQLLQYYDPKSSGKGGRKTVLTTVVATTEDRPVYNDVTNNLKKAANQMSEQ